MLQTNSILTRKEIFQQPQMWMETYRSILQKQSQINSFIFSDNLEETDIVLTGAGSSAFIGDILAFILPKHDGFNYRSISTTDLTTHANQLFSEKKKTILVSFARSGNSPESVAVVKLADEVCGDNVKHIAITCNEDGLLARETVKRKGLLINLPEKTNDKALAMTSSFTSMLLACLLIFDIKNIYSVKEHIQKIGSHAESILKHHELSIKKIAELDFNRAVFLGSGALKGVAEECHLKLQELTDGKVICKYDSFLGFRHGPKAVLNNKTLIVYLFSENNHVLQYEKDLVNQINQQVNPVAQIGVSLECIKLDDDYLNLQICSENNTHSVYNIIPYVIVGQLLGLHKSLSLRLDPDNPSTSGKIARVVEGVKIYENTL